MYRNGSLSASQIADELGLSKQAVLSRLREQGIRNQASRGRSPDNFRYPFPPYGYRVVDGRLAVNRREMKAARLIVELRDRKNLEWVAIVKSLNEKGFRSRTGLPWNRVRLKRVHKLWSGKI